VFMCDLAEIGIIVIMLALGCTENFSAFLNSIKRTRGIALFGAIAPFVATHTPILHFRGEASGALICALAMTATAVSLTMISLRSVSRYGGGTESCNKPRRKAGYQGERVSRRN